MKQLRVIDRIAAARGLDTVAGAVRDATHAVLRPGTVKDFLHGLWRGHPLHPALAQFSVGCITGAAVLDVTGLGRGAVRLIRFGILGSLPAASAGLADYADSHEEQQRIGVATSATDARSAPTTRPRCRTPARQTGPISAPSTTSRPPSRCAGWPV